MRAEDAGTVRCPNCHAVMVAGMRFCRMCGYRLGEGVAEYAETRRFDGAAPPAGATADRPDAGTRFNTPHAWGAVAPVNATPPAQAGTSSLRKFAAACRPKHLGTMFWIILMVVVLMAGGLAVRNVRDRRAGAGVGASAPQSFLEADGFETADGGGAFIEGLRAPDTSLERAGLLGGDVIVNFDGQPVRDADAMRKIVAATPPGKTVEVVYIRDGETKKTTLTTVDRKSFRGLEVLDSRPGGRGVLGVDDLDRVRVPDSNIYGVELGEVQRNRPADIAGLKEGDIVIEFNGKPIRTPGDLRLRIYEAEPGSTANVVVMRGGERVEVPVKMGRGRG